jgi:heptosyltransferase II
VGQDIFIKVLKKPISAPRLLVVAPNWIGDALMAQPLLARLREKLAGTRIEVLAPRWVAPVARRMVEVDEVIEADLRHGALQLGERWRLGRKLKQRGYDQAIVLPNTWKAALVPLFAGIPVRSGYVGESRYGILNLLYRKKAEREPMAVHYARLSERPGIEPDLPLPFPSFLFDRAKIKTTAARFGISGPYTVFCPGAEYGPAKRWPYFRELASKLDCQIVLLGSSSDKKEAEQIPGTNLVGQTTLDEAIDLIAGAAVVVSNDSGLMHVAAATGTPQVALFGSSSPEHTPPLSPAARVVWLKIECSPCFARVCPLGHFKCMNDMSVERVMREIKALS